jgi:hypothetical protein
MLNCRVKLFFETSFVRDDKIKKAPNSGLLVLTGKANEIFVEDRFIFS